MQETPVHLNTGADVSIITSCQWPDDWPLTEPQGEISGLGEPQQLAQIAATWWIALQDGVVMAVRTQCHPL